MRPLDTMEIRRRPSREEINRSEIMLATSCSWRRFEFRQRGGEFATPIVQRDGHPDILFEGGEKTGQRIAECWNACRGIPTEALETGVVGEMVTAFQNVMGYLDTPIARRKLGIDSDEKWLLEARALLSKIKGDSHG